ncbi:hypothetical protein K490DRAFT_69019 [Saccharata proteae CBS 121410]|uniref:Uncharacterized protein n=1 Tax=Saccharata proteae CBS 121410 TaxID=1314787 RepID=A0A9P4HPD1_9PEZI|nr:hypothetical protein K490DRAFT_69019 [Saccharata proteae CBS 121410]
MDAAVPWKRGDNFLANRQAIYKPLWDGQALMAKEGGDLIDSLVTDWMERKPNRRTRARSPPRDRIVTREFIKADRQQWEKELKSGRASKETREAAAAMRLRGAPEDQDAQRGRAANEANGDAATQPRREGLPPPTKPIDIPGASKKTLHYYLPEELDACLHYEEYQPEEKEEQEEVKEEVGQVQTIVRQVQATKRQVQAARKQVQATGKQVQATGKQVQTTGKQVQATGKQVQVTGKQVQATNRPVQATERTIQPTERTVQPTEKPVQIAESPRPLPIKPAWRNDSFVNRALAAQQSGNSGACFSDSDEEDDDETTRHATTIGPSRGRGENNNVQGQALHGANQVGDDEDLYEDAPDRRDTAISSQEIKNGQNWEVAQAGSDIGATSSLIARWNLEKARAGGRVVETTVSPLESKAATNDHDQHRQEELPQKQANSDGEFATLLDKEKSARTSALDIGRRISASAPHGLGSFSLLSASLRGHSLPTVLEKEEEDAQSKWRVSGRADALEFLPVRREQHVCHQRMPSDGQTQVESAESSDGQTPVESAESSDGQTRVESSKSSDGQTPVESSKSSDGQTQVERSKSSDGQTPVESSKSSDGQTPVESSKSSDGQTPVESSKSSLCPGLGAITEDATVPMQPSQPLANVQSADTRKSSLCPGLKASTPKASPAETIVSMESARSSANAQSTKTRKSSPSPFCPGVAAPTSSVDRSVHVSGFLRTRMSTSHQDSALYATRKARYPATFRNGNEDPWLLIKPDLRTTRQKALDSINAYGWNFTF